ncbi:MAG: hypothetical protein JXR88_08540 [Clostridia bacterium]|nr:hypothetical protein [Clostridia bacterium]
MKRTIWILGILVLSISTAVYLKISLAFGFILPIAVVLLSTRDKKNHIKSALHQVYQCKSVFAIIILLGANITVWMSSGLLPTIIFYGLNFAEHMNLLLITFLGTMIISLVMGTGLGTFSTIGIVFLALAMPLGYPKAVIIGCIVSGAFISDKISPVSALVNLTLQVTHIDYKSYLRTALKTLLPVILITAVLYGFLNGRYQSNIPMEISSLQSNIYEIYDISLGLLVIPALMLIFAVINLPTTLNMMIMFILGSLSAIIIQQVSTLDWLKYVIFGYHIQVEDAFLMDIFKGGGILPMVEVLIIVSMAVFLTGLLMAGKLLDPLIHLVLHKTRKQSELILKTSLLSMFLTSITCDQTVGIIIPAQTLKEPFQQKQLSAEILARVISDSGTIIAPIEFWNVNALIITGLTGISALQYGPYALLCYISPIFMILYSFVKFNKGEQLQ